MRIQRRAGFTMFEMMVVMGLMGVFSLFMVNLTILSQSAWANGYTSVYLRTEAKRTMETMVKELREAVPEWANNDGIVVPPGDPSQITFGVPDEIDSEGVDSWRFVRYQYVAGNQQIERLDCGADPACGGVPPPVPVVIARNVSQLQFTNPDIGGDGDASNDDIVIAAITTQGTTRDGRVLSTNLSTRVSVRNVGS
jgi:prepilin-type N-terminal cleavage/methylation domain-containing protein